MVPTIRRICIWRAKYVGNGIIAAGEKSVCVTERGMAADTNEERLRRDYHGMRNWSRMINEKKASELLDGIRKKGLPGSLGGPVEREDLCTLPFKSHGLETKKNDAH